MSPPTKTITLITGANRGIGLATATALSLAPHSHHVIIGSRSASDGATAAATIRAQGGSASHVQLDLSSDDSIAAAVKVIESQFGRLDVLVNNAGILLDGKEPEQEEKKMSSSGVRELFERTFATNVVGTACLTDALVPLLRKAGGVPRVVFVSSRMGSLAQAKIKDTMYYAIDYKAYDASKAAVNMLALNYARILEDAGGKVNVVCPGLVKTGLSGWHEYGTSTEVGARRVVELACLGRDGPTASFSDREGEIAW